MPIKFLWKMRIVFTSSPSKIVDTLSNRAIKALSIFQYSKVWSIIFFLTFFQKNQFRKLFHGIDCLLSFKNSNIEWSKID